MSEVRWPRRTGQSRRRARTRQHVAQRSVTMSRAAPNWVDWPLRPHRYSARQRGVGDGSRAASARGQASSRAGGAPFARGVAVERVHEAAQKVVHAAPPRVTAGEEAVSPTCARPAGGRGGCGERARAHVVKGGDRQHLRGQSGGQAARGRAGSTDKARAGARQRGGEVAGGSRRLTTRR